MSVHSAFLTSVSSQTEVASDLRYCKTRNKTPLLRERLQHRTFNYKLNEDGYKKADQNLTACRNTLKEKLNPSLFFDCQDIKTWQHLDALLALFGAMRFVMGRADTFGNVKEGLVYV